MSCVFRISTPRHHEVKYGVQVQLQRRRVLQHELEYRGCFILKCKTSKKGVRNSDRELCILDWHPLPLPVARGQVECQLQRS
jgi:hypothetical protein